MEDVNFGQWIDWLKALSDEWGRAPEVFAVVLGTLVGSYVARRLVLRVGRATGRTRTVADDALAAALAQPIRLLIWVIVSGGLRPLRALAHELGSKQPDDLTPLTIEQPRKELEQIVASCNGLLQWGFHFGLDRLRPDGWSTEPAMTTAPILFHDIDGILFGNYAGEFQLRPGVKSWLAWAYEHF